MNFTVDDGTAATDLLVSAAITQSAGTVGITKLGAGLMALTGTNTYTGTTTISGGTLSLSGGLAIANTGPVVMSNAADTYLSLQANETIGSLSGGGILGGNVLLNNFVLTTGGNNTSTSFAGIISGSGGITKTGTGTLTLSGNNNYSGLTTVSGGTTGSTPTLVVGHNNALGSTAGGTTVIGTQASSGIGSTRLQLVNGITVTGETLTLNTTAGQRAALYANNTNGNAAWNGNIIIDGSGNVTNVGAMFIVDAGTLTIGANSDNTIDANGLSLTLRGSATGTINSTINLGSGALLKTDQSTWTIASANNTYTGDTNILVGTLEFGTIANAGVNSSIGAGANINLGQQAGTLSDRTGTMRFNGTSGGASDRTILIANTATPTTGVAVGVIENTVAGQTLTLSGNIAAAIQGSAASLSVQGAGDMVLSGRIFGSLMTLAKNGTGTLTLAGANTFTGVTTISAGTLKLGAADSGANSPLGTSANGTTVASGAVLDLNGFSLLTAEALTLNGTGISSGGALTNSSVTSALYTGLITLGSASSIVAASGDIVLSNTGIITGNGFGLTLGGNATGSSLASIIGTGSGSVTKQGTGTWTLTGENTYTGATLVSAGTLLVNGAPTGTSAVTVSAGATLGGIGSIKGAVTDSGILSPGASVGAVGTLNVNGNVNFSAGGTLHIDIDGKTTDELIITGTVDVTNLIVDLAYLNAPDAGTYTILSASTLTGTIVPSHIIGLGVNDSIAIVGGQYLIFTHS